VVRVVEKLRYCLIRDYWVPFPSPLKTRRDYGGSILTHLHTGRTFWTLYSLLPFIEREKKVGRGVVRDTTVLEGGVIET
jgi:hypothetical protein